MSISSANMMQLHGQTQAQMQSQDITLKQKQVGNLGKSNLSDVEKEKKLREACEGFESVFIQKMWQQMRATLPQENPLVGREEKFWQGMYDQELSKHMASSGGIGLADMMYEQLSQNLLSASRTTATAIGEKQGFSALAAPLIPSGTQSAQKETEANTVALKTTDQAQVAAKAKKTADEHKAEPENTAHNNGNTVAQFLATLQAKQAQYAKPATEEDSIATAKTGLERAQQAKHVAQSPAPSHGILPPKGPYDGTQVLQAQMGNEDAQTVRTTYTTNIPGRTISPQELAELAQEKMKKNQEFMQPASASSMQPMGPITFATQQNIAPVTQVAQAPQAPQATVATPVAPLVANTLENPGAASPLAPLTPVNPMAPVSPMAPSLPIMPVTPVAGMTPAPQIQPVIQGSQSSQTAPAETTASSKKGGQSTLLAPVGSLKSVAPINPVANNTQAAFTPHIAAGAQAEGIQKPRIFTDLYEPIDTSS